MRDDSVHFPKRKPGIAVAGRFVPSIIAEGAEAPSLRGPGRYGGDGGKGALGGFHRETGRLAAGGNRIGSPSGGVGNSAVEAGEGGVAGGVDPRNVDMESSHFPDAYTTRKIGPPQTFAPPAGNGGWALPPPGPGGWKDPNHPSRRSPLIPPAFRRPPTFGPMVPPQYPPRFSPPQPLPPRYSKASATRASMAKSVGVVGASLLSVMENSAGARPSTARIRR